MLQVLERDDRVPAVEEMFQDVRCSQQEARHRGWAEGQQVEEDEGQGGDICCVSLL